MGRLSLIIIWVAFNTAATFGGEKTESAAESLARSDRHGLFLATLDQHFAGFSQGAFQLQSNSGNASKQKSVSKAALLSLAIPGTGEFYGGSLLKGVAFLAVEVGALYGNFHFRNRGNDLEDQFQADANSLWNEDAYWDWLSVIGGVDRGDQQALRNFERQTFSHFLPENKNQQYYENIGKYDQFVIGWEDFRNDLPGDDVSQFAFEDYQSGFYMGEDLTTISGQRNAYVELRRDSNDNFKKATTMVTVVLLNHVASALDAGLTVKRHNQKILQAKVGIQGVRHNDELIAALALGVSW